MSADSPEPSPARKWSWLRWLAAVAIVFLAHVVLIFVFGVRKPPPQVPVRHTPSLSLVPESSGDWLALNDTTLFALPANNGFAASMWTELPPLNIHPRNWTEEPHWLDPSNSIQMAGLFAGFNEFVKTNRFAAIHFEFNVPPETPAPLTPIEPPIAQQSTLRINGELAGRQLLDPRKLPSWQDADIDAPSIVQVLVNPAGNVVSAVLLPQEVISDGSSWEPPLTHNAKADQWAVELARSLHFTPLPPDKAMVTNAMAHLTLGQLTFNWQTVPQTGTNVTNF
ncbi:MAG TPA: hypothetical protein VGY98_18280 [Verrucomicrobiae bacterium]|nr:hypothetical protein [Verrucomicrobiae bacterium]